MNFSTDQFNQALLFAANVHGKQKMKGSKLPYIVHSTMAAVEISSILDDIPDKDCDLVVQTALLHDVLEDTKTTREELRAEFGEEVEYCVFLLSKEIKSECGKKKEPHEYLNYLANGPRAAQIVKLADRIVNLRQPPSTWNNKKIFTYAQEADEILEQLGSANQALAARLKDRIDNYRRRYVKTG